MVPNPQMCLTISNSTLRLSNFWHFSPLTSACRSKEHFFPQEFFFSLLPKLLSMPPAHPDVATATAFLTLLNAVVLQPLLLLSLQNFNWAPVPHQNPFQSPSVHHHTPSISLYSFNAKFLSTPIRTKRKNSLKLSPPGSLSPSQH